MARSAYRRNWKAWFKMSLVWILDPLRGGWRNLVPYGRHAVAGTIG
jgi:hypothetical protein